MDMPISHINTRLFSRLPSDLGMGLLFATGTVSQIIVASGDRPIQFTLRDAGYALCCKISPNVEQLFKLAEGQRIRATGHLSFSSQSARFHLVIRDVELLVDAEPKSPSVKLWPSKEIMTTAYPHDGRQSVLTAPVQLALAEIPDWVYALAPPEVRSPGTLWGTEPAVEERSGGTPPDEYRTATHNKLEENEQLLTFLLEALDRSENEDVELTAEVMAEFRGVSPAEPPSPVVRSPRFRGAAHARQETTTFPSIVSSGVWLLVMFLFLIVGAMLILLFLLFQAGFL